MEYLREVEGIEREQGSADLVVWARLSRGETVRVLDEIRARIYDYLSRTEMGMIAGNRPDVLVRSRQYVFESLAHVAPQAVEQLNEAEAAVADGTAERYSHAVLSCRRALKTLADAVYPAQDQRVAGADGTERSLTEERYISRLWQFAYEMAGGHAAGELVLATIQDLGRRIDAVYDAASKGVHDAVGEHEAFQYVAQTILLMADLLLLRDKSSAVTIELDDDLPVRSRLEAPPES